MDRERELIDCRDIDLVFFWGGRSAVDRTNDNEREGEMEGKRPSNAKHRNGSMRRRVEDYTRKHFPVMFLDRSR